MSAAHTPSPWGREGDFHDLCRVEFSGGGHYVTISNPDRTMPVAFVIGDPDAYWRDDVEVEANARLIAAAPDLLEALREFIALVDMTGGDEAETMARAAIRKATTAVEPNSVGTPEGVNQK